MSETMFKAGQALTRAYKKFDDFAQKGLITTIKDKFKNRPTTANPKINRPGKIVSSPPAKITGKSLAIFDPKKALPAIKGAAKTAKKVSKIGRIARAATPIGLGLEAANIAYKVATRTPEMKARSKALKTKLSKTKTKDYHSDLLKMSVGGDTMLKKIPEGPKGEGLRKLKAKRPDVTRKMGFAKKGKMLKANVGMAAKKVRENQMMKASMGKSVRGYGAARTSGMGLQDEQLPPGKSLDYYKDLM